MVRVWNECHSEFTVEIKNIGPQKRASAHISPLAKGAGEHVCSICSMSAHLPDASANGVAKVHACQLLAQKHPLSTHPPRQSTKPEKLGNSASR